jgi:hypothetical protein
MIVFNRKTKYMWKRTKKIFVSCDERNTLKNFHFLSCTLSQWDLRNSRISRNYLESKVRVSATQSVQRNFLVHRTLSRLFRDAKYNVVLLYSMLNQHLYMMFFLVMSNCPTTMTKQLVEPTLLYGKYMRPQYD